MIFPKNFDLLHSGQEEIRQRSKKAIAGSEALRRHFCVVAESMTLINHFARAYASDGDDQRTVQLLGLRLFNSSAGAVQSLMGGYYQNAVMLERDLLEVSFLLDYLHSNTDRIAEWRGCGKSERNKKFGALKIRTALDDRDGFTERKRAGITSCCANTARTHPIRALNCFVRHPVQTLIAGHTLRRGPLTPSRPSWPRCV